MTDPLGPPQKYRGATLYKIGTLSVPTAALQRAGIDGMRVLLSRKDSAIVIHGTRGNGFKVHSREGYPNKKFIKANSAWRTLGFDLGETTYYDVNDDEPGCITLTPTTRPS